MHVEHTPVRNRSQLGTDAEILRRAKAQKLERAEAKASAQADATPAIVADAAQLPDGLDLPDGLRDDAPAPVPTSPTAASTSAGTAAPEQMPQPGSASPGDSKLDHELSLMYAHTEVRTAARPQAEMPQPREALPGESEADYHRYLTYEYGEARKAFDAMQEAERGVKLPPANKLLRFPTLEPVNRSEERRVGKEC